MEERSRRAILVAVEFEDVAEAEVEAAVEAEEEEVLEVETGMREGKLMHVLIAERKVTGPEIVHRVEILGVQHD